MSRVSAPGRVGVPSVGVTVDLHRGPDAGGHVKVWERLADAAAEAPDLVDLTIYTLGEQEGVEQVAGNVRFVGVRPVLDSGHVHRLLARPADATDLAPHHATAARLLSRHDLLHATHGFALSRTAVRVARRRRIPLVASVHTDTPALALEYARQLRRGWSTGPSRPTRLVGRLPLDTLAVAAARRSRAVCLRTCDEVLVSNDEDRATIAGVVPGGRIAMLRLGIDKLLYHPDKRDRAWLHSAFGIPPDRPVVLFAGRADQSKRVLLVARVVRALLDQGYDLHLFVAGEGADIPGITRLLGTRATVPGMVTQETLARIYPSCEVFVFPSLTETAGSVVIEAMAAGLPVVLPRTARTAQWLRAPGTDGVVVPDSDERGWVTAVAALVADPRRRAILAAGARACAERFALSWSEVLAQDLLPVWQRHALAGRQATSVRPVWGLGRAEDEPVDRVAHLDDGFADAPC